MSTNTPQNNLNDILDIDIDLDLDIDALLEQTETLEEETLNTIEQAEQEKLRRELAEAEAKREALRKEHEAQQIRTEQRQIHINHHKTISEGKKLAAQTQSGIEGNTAYKSQLKILDEQSTSTSEGLNSAIEEAFSVRGAEMIAQVESLNEKKTILAGKIQSLENLLDTGVNTENIQQQLGALNDMLSKIEQGVFALKSRQEALRESIEEEIKNAQPTQEIDEQRQKIHAIMNTQAEIAHNPEDFYDTSLKDSLVLKELDELYTREDFPKEYIALPVETMIAELESNLEVSYELQAAVQRLKELRESRFEESKSLRTVSALLANDTEFQFHFKDLIEKMEELGKNFPFINPYAKERQYFNENITLGDKTYHLEFPHKLWNARNSHQKEYFIEWHKYLKTLPKDIQDLSLEEFVEVFKTHITRQKINSRFKEFETFQNTANTAQKLITEVLPYYPALPQMMDNIRNEYSEIEGLLINEYEIEDFQPLTDAANKIGDLLDTKNYINPNETISAAHERVARIESLFLGSTSQFRNTRLERMNCPNPKQLLAKNNLPAVLEYLKNLRTALTQYTETDEFKSTPPSKRNELFPVDSGDYFYSKDATMSFPKEFGDFAEHNALPKNSRIDTITFNFEHIIKNEDFDSRFDFRYRKGNKTLAEQYKTHLEKFIDKDFHHGESKVWKLLHLSFKMESLDEEFNQRSINDMKAIEQYNQAIRAQEGGIPKKREVDSLLKSMKNEKGELPCDNLSGFKVIRNRNNYLEISGASSYAGKIETLSSQIQSLERQNELLREGLASKNENYQDIQYFDAAREEELQKLKKKSFLKNKRREENIETLFRNKEEIASKENEIKKLKQETYQAVQMLNEKLLPLIESLSNNTYSYKMPKNREDSLYLHTALREIENLEEEWSNSINRNTPSENFNQEYLEKYTQYLEKEKSILTRET